MSKGFGGKFGIEKDRIDQSAHGWEQSDAETRRKGFRTNVDKEVVKGKASDLKARFENMGKTEDDIVKKRAEEERLRRVERENLEKEEAKKAEEERQKKLKLERKSAEVLDDETEDLKPSRETSSKKTNRIGVSVFPTKQNEVTVCPAVEDVSSSNVIVEEEKEDEQVPSKSQQTNGEDVSSTKVEPTPEKNIVLLDLGLTAKALYDYQAADYDEISFDPDDLITNIEKIDEGWWRGECKGIVGLFPANYVQLNE